MKKLLLLLLLLLPLTACERTTLPDTPKTLNIFVPTQDDSWQLASPETVGVNGERLKELHSELANVEIYAVVTVKDGYIIDEYYKEGYSEKTRFALYSCTKSITSALIGIAIENGFIEGTDVKLTAYFPQLAASEDARKQDIAVKHLLNQTAGITWAESPGDSLRHMVKEEENWVDYILSLPMEKAPGAKFNYSTGNSHLLTALLQQATGERAYTFGKKYLFEPLGMTSVRWSVDKQGIAAGGNGLSMTARDAAKFGLLYANGGKWEGQQIVPEAWVDASTKTQSDGQQGSVFTHGYQWWIGERYYFAQGHGGQYIFVVPEKNLVTVITSSLEGNAALPRTYFTNYILAACN